MKSALRVCFSVAAMTTFGAAMAAPTVYFAEDTSTSQDVAGTNSAAKRVAFLGGLEGVGNEDFESPGHTAGTVAPLALTFPGALTATLQGAGCVDTTIAVIGQCGATLVNSNPGRWATSGLQFWEVSSGGTFQISFGSTPISAFGFYATDIGDFDNQLIIDLKATDDTVTSLTVGHSLNLPNSANSLLFWGFIDTSVAYKEIAFRNAGTGGDTFGFDDMVIGALSQVCPPGGCQVPTPGTLPLAALALFGLGAGVARRRA
jgi:hypothetical protein